MFHTAEDYKPIRKLTDNVEVILAEYLKVSSKTKQWPEAHLHNGKWEAYGIKFQGEDLINECPKTTEIINSIPGVFIAGFSVLKAGCVITPHVGYTDSVWRLHLGLICPPNCWIRVGEETHHWKKGEAVLFDDTIEHEAANESDSDRVILIVDVKK